MPKTAAISAGAMHEKQDYIKVDGLQLAIYD